MHSIPNDEWESLHWMPWVEFVERTSGLLTDDPVEYPAQLLHEEREPLD